MTSYALLRRDEEMLKEIDWRYVILDEAQQIKNPLSATAARGQAPQGRPAPRAQRHAHREPPQRDLVDLRLRVARACSARSTSSRSATRAPSTRATRGAPQRLRATIHPFILRRTKAEVARDLPEKIETDQFCELTGEQAALYAAVLKEVRAQVMGEVERAGPGAEPASRSSPASRACARRRATRACSGCRASSATRTRASSSRCASSCETRIEGGHRVLVFSQFVSMLQIIKRAMDEDGVDVRVPRRVDQGPRRARRELPARRRAAGLPHLAQGGRQRPEPDRRRHRHPLRPVVEPGGRGPGDRSRPPHRADARSSRPTGSSRRARSRRRSSSSPRRSASSSARCSPRTSAARRSSPRATSKTSSSSTTEARGARGGSPSSPIGRH